MCAHLSNDLVGFVIIVPWLYLSLWRLGVRAGSYKNCLTTAAAYDTAESWRESAISHITQNRLYKSSPKQTTCKLLAKLWSLWKVWFRGKECFVFGLKGHTVCRLYLIQHSGLCPSDHLYLWIKLTHSINSVCPLAAGSASSRPHIT